MRRATHTSPVRMINKVEFLFSVGTDFDFVGGALGVKAGRWKEAWSKTGQEGQAEAKTACRRGSGYSYLRGAAAVA
jgi:hypothetical protein